MNAQEIASLSETLYTALRRGEAVDPLANAYPSITIDNAYQVSLAMLQMRERDGERLIGKKIGVTSEAVQNMLNVRQPDFGFLTDKMICEDSLSLSSMIAPRAEGEIAFILGKDLSGPGVTEQDVLEATESVMPCFEIVDSRIRDWKITIQDTVADNASCGYFAINRDAAKDPRELDLVACKMSVFKNGEKISEGSGAAALGNPLTCVAWLANTLGEYGISLNAGDVILSGSLVPLEPIQAGDSMRVEIDSIGSISLDFN